LQESVVQTLPSSQFSGVPTQLGPEPVTVQRSPVVQGLPSSQGSVDGTPRQIPVLHLSKKVQGFPSLQDAVLNGWTQAPEALHMSKVHSLPSSQLSA